MPAPSINAIILGIVFVFVGLIKAMCDRWQNKIKVEGTPTSTPHFFDHMFLLWFLSQLLQLILLPLWKAIESNTCGMGRFRHGEVEPRANARLRQPQRRGNLLDDNPLDGNGHQAAAAIVGDDENQGAIVLDAQDGNVINDADADADRGEQEPLLNNKPRRKNRTPSFLIYFPPAFFSQAHILLLCFGLKLTYGSSFIMLKGTVTFFTALLSMAFLAQQLACYVWFGVVVATLGFGVSGISDYIHTPSGGYEKYGIAAGDLLIVMAQIMFATKIIYEEKFIRKHSIHPMVFLGWEAVYGFFFAFIFLIVFNFVDAVQYSMLPNARLEDVADAALQWYNSWEVKVAVGGSLIFYILYTYLGMFLIRDQGALPRIMIETFVWAMYWAICLALGWEHFFIAQVPGACVILIGVLIYSHILLIPFVSRRDPIDNGGPDLFQGMDNFANLNDAAPRERGEEDGNGHYHADDDDDDALGMQREGHNVEVDVHQADNADNRAGADVPMIQA